MKKIIAIILSFALCFAFVSCGETEKTAETDTEEAAQSEEGLSDEIYAAEEFDFGLTLTDEHNLSEVFEKCEYADLIEREMEFKEILSNGLTESGLDDFEVDNTSLKEQIDHAITELKADGNPVDEEMIKAYKNNVFASANEQVGEDDRDGAMLEIGITSTGEDFDEADEEDVIPEAVSEGKFQHCIIYVGSTYHDRESANCDKICSDLERLMGVRVNPSKHKESFDRAIELAESTDKIAELNQDVTVHGDGYEDIVYFYVSAYFDNEVLSFGIEGCERYRIYE